MIERIERFDNFATPFNLKGLLKFLIFIFLMGLFLIHHSVIRLVLWNQNVRLRYFLRSISLTSKLVCSLLRIDVDHIKVKGEVNCGLIVANHLSYLDVLILFSLYPSLFITSQEIKETPVLGQICELGGCFFVERRKEKRTLSTMTQELQSVKNKLDQGFNIFLFPEGTSSDGHQVLPFKATFFQVAVDSQSPVQPMCIKYKGENRDLIPWFGDMTFIDHLFKLCMLTEINVELIVSPAFCGTNKYDLATLSQEIIRNNYEPS